jgi:potassium-dependent mechanosensitive channel
MSDARRCDWGLMSLKFYRFLLAAGFAVILSAASSFAQVAPTDNAPAAASPATSGSAAGSATTPSVATSPAGAAPVASPAQPDAVTVARDELTAIAKTLGGLAEAVDKDSNDDQKLVDLKVKVELASKAIIDATVSLHPQLSHIRDRLTALGDPPKDGAAEDPALQNERQKLSAERASINALTAEAENLSISATKLANRITDVRRALFTGTLFKQTDINGAMIDDALSAVQGEVDAFNRSVGSWFKFVWRYKFLQLMGALFLSTLIALVLAVLGNRVFKPLIRRGDHVQNPPYISRLSVAYWSTMIPSLSMAVFATAIYFLMANFNVLRPDIAPIVASFLKVIVAVFFIFMLSVAVLSPFAENWRLIDVSNRGARLLVLSVFGLAVVNSLDYFYGDFSELLGSPVILTVVKSLFSSVIAGLILIAISLIRPMRAKGASADAPGQLWPRPVGIAFGGAGLCLIISAALGYVGLARFAATQFVMTSAIVATMYIGLLSGRAVIARGALAPTFVGDYLKHRFKLGELELDQAGLVCGLGIYVIVLAIGLPLLLLQWGFQTQEIELWVVELFTEISIGKFRFSLLGIMVGIALFFAGLFATKWFQRWLDGNVLSRSKLDTGVRNSVSTGLGYVGVAIASLIGISAAGIDLSSLALVAGALSLGIGFGLQNIVNNFVSGLILLVERPFKVGDWVITGTTEGFVRRISVRATEIETFQHQSIIVPNSELINASVGNWMHKNRLGRTDIAIGVGYNSDPRRVMEILLEIAQAHMKVLKSPEPAVAFLAFGDSSLDFELRVHLADILDGLNVRNDLRLEIFERFRAEGIEIPFPQRDLNIKLDGGTAVHLREAVSQRGVFRGNPDVVPDNMGGLRAAHSHHGNDDDGDGDGDNDGQNQ